MAEKDLKLITIYSFLDIFKNLDIFEKINLTFKSVENYVESQNPTSLKDIYLIEKISFLKFKFLFN